jgi:hypothetical protein
MRASLTQRQSSHRYGGIARAKSQSSSTQAFGYRYSNRISAGFCIVSPECELTDLQLVEKAGRAKKLAKQQPGKNAAATYKGQSFGEADLVVLQDL